MYSREPNFRSLKEERKEERKKNERKEERKNRMSVDYIYFIINEFSNKIKI